MCQIVSGALPSGSERIQEVHAPILDQKRPGARGSTCVMPPIPLNRSRLRSTGMAHDQRRRRRTAWTSDVQECVLAACRVRDGRTTVRCLRDVLERNTGRRVSDVTIRRGLIDAGYVRRRVSSKVLGSASDEDVTAFRTRFNQAVGPGTVLVSVDESHFSRRHFSRCASVRVQIAWSKGRAQDIWPRRRMDFVLVVARNRERRHRPFASRQGVCQSPNVLCFRVIDAISSWIRTAAGQLLHPQEQRRCFRRKDIHADVPESIQPPISTC